MRFLIAFPIAFALTVSVLLIIASLIEKPQDKREQKSSTSRYNLVVNDTVTEAQRRQRILPEKPKPHILPRVSSADTTLSLASLATSHLSPVSAPIADLNISDFSIEIAAPGFGDWETEPTHVQSEANTMPRPVQKPLVAIHKPEPDYPQSAKKRKVEGYVILTFSIDEKGRTKNIEILEAEPPRVFNRSAMNALRKWRYQPPEIEGEAKSSDGHQVTMEFNLQ